ncbi:MAG: ABC transporter ATP-binding protein [Minisyncoccales bacterium]
MLLKISGLEKSFDNKTVLKNISLSLDEEEITCFLGPSGCGKSTLLRIIADLENAEKSAIENNSNKTSFIFQDHRLLPWLTAFKNVELVLKNKIKNKKKREKIVKETLNNVQLDGYHDYYPDNLSGGMKQRVSVARALALKPQLLLMDEPFSNLDFPLRLDLIDLFTKIFKNEKISGVFVTHDTREAILLCDEIMIMSKDPGQIQKKVNIDIPRTERDLNSREMIQINKKLTKYLHKPKHRHSKRGYKKRTKKKIGGNYSN